MILPFLFLLSGFSSLIFEAIFTRLLTYTFGNTAYAVSTVLAAFLAGLAAGSFCIGRWIDQRPAKLQLYGRLELLIGFICLAVPYSFSPLTAAYVGIYHALHLGAGGLLGLRFGLAGILVFIPSFLMGGTLPVIARYLDANIRDFQPVLTRLYAWNTFGGAVGVLLASYVLIPILGINGTVLTAALVNIGIFVFVATRGPQQASASTVAVTDDAASHNETIRPSSLLLLTVSLLTGAVALSYEVVWTHALSFLIGNTVYAFALMLFTVLAGLALGARIVERRIRSPRLWPASLAGSQLLLGIAVLVTLPLWPLVPRLFAHGLSGAYNRVLFIVQLLLIGRITYVFWKNRRDSCSGPLPWYRAYEPHIVAITFAVVVNGLMPFLWRYDQTFFFAGELLRFLCVFLLLIVPALLVGMGFPLLLNLHVERARTVASKVGVIYALNTAGTVVGSLLSGFVLLPRFGSSVTMKVCAAMNIGLGLVFLWITATIGPAKRLVLSCVVLLFGIVFLSKFGAWNMSNVTGSYAYFTEGWPGERILYQAEDVQGGLTSVVQRGPLRSLLSNGKFQGDNGPEMGTQTRFGLIPALFTQNFNRALVIGLGTGSTLRTVARFPFEQIDVAELSPHLVQASREWFRDINLGVIDHPRVSVEIADGRNYLLLSQRRYDMITIEITSLWISGEADLYNKEFYELCRAHLTDHGVLQQWVAIHHLRTPDLLVALNTAARVFPHVAFFHAEGEPHGFLIASASPLQVDYPQIERFDSDPNIGRELKLIGLPSAWSLLGELVVMDGSLRNAASQLPSVAGLPSDFVSSDFQPYLEYQAPKGIATIADTVAANAEFLSKFRSPGLPPELVITSISSENERNLVFGYEASARKNRTSAAAYFAKVEGNARERAQAELKRLNQPGKSK